MHKRLRLSLVTGCGLVLIGASLVVLNKQLHRSLADSLPASAAATEYLTKRFGECSTCDPVIDSGTGQPKTVFYNASLPATGTYDPASTDLSYRYDYGARGLAFRIDLSSIPAGKAIKRATLRLFMKTDGLTGTTNNKEFSIPVYKINDPSTSGLWDGTGMSYLYKKAGIKWSASGTGDIDSAGVLDKTNPLGSLILKNYSSYYKTGTMVTTYREVDLTGAVQGWVDSAATNYGFYIPANPSLSKIAWSKSGPASLRPYLEVQYEGANDESIPAPTNIQTKNYKGQTFITWDEASTGKDETSYRIYRSKTGPITNVNAEGVELLDEVYQGSSWIDAALYGHNTQGFLPDEPYRIAHPELYEYQGKPTVQNINQPNLSKAGVTLHKGGSGQPFPTDSGLYVYINRSDQSENAYYAVTTVVEGNESQHLTAGQNASSSSVAEVKGIPDAFFLETSGNGNYAGYVMWLGNYNPKDASDTYGFFNRQSMPVLFSLVLPKRVTTDQTSFENLAQFTGKEGPYPLTTHLHSAGHDYFESGEGADQCASVDSSRYGGFCLDFQDFTKITMKDAQGTFLDLGYYTESTNGASRYTGWNSNLEPSLVPLFYPPLYGDTERVTAGEGNYLKCAKTAEGAACNPTTDSKLDDWTTLLSPDVSSFRKFLTQTQAKPMTEGTGVPYVLKTIKFVIEWMQNDGPWKNYIDKDRLYFEGGSMGAIGSLNFATNYPEMVAAIDASQGRVENCPLDATEIIFGSYTDQESTIRMADGKKVLDFLNLPKRIQDEPNKPYPFMRLLNGKRDTLIDWRTIPHFYDVLESTKVGEMAYFDQSDHNGFETAYFPDFSNRRTFVQDVANNRFNLFHFSLKKSYPSFANTSINNDPGTGTGDFTTKTYDGDLRGRINSFTYWDTASVQDTTNSYSMKLLVIPGSTTTTDLTADVTLHRLQNIPHTVGTTYIWKNVRASDNAELATGVTTADANGLVTVPSFALNKDQPSKLELTVTSAGTNMNLSIKLNGRKAPAQTLDQANHADTVSGELLSVNGTPLNPAQTFTTTSSQDGSVTLSSLVVSAVATIEANPSTQYVLKVRPLGYLPQSVSVSHASIATPPVFQAFNPGAFAGSGDRVQLADFAALAAYYNGGQGSPGVAAAYGTRPRNTLLSEFAQLAARYNAQ